MRGQSVLFSEMTPEASWEETFNEWYNEEHIPLRMEVSGFVGAQRYQRNDRDYLAVYDITSPEVLQSDAYVNLKTHPSKTTEKMLTGVSNFSRYIGRDIGTQHNVDLETMLLAPVLYPVFFQVPNNCCEEFDDWYNEDHVPTLLEEPKWLGCRRFALEKTHPHPFNRLALHYLQDAETLDCSARSQARNSTWRKKLASESWFKGTYMVFNRHNGRFKGYS